MLRAEEMNGAFLKHFLPETVFLLKEEEAFINHVQEQPVPSSGSPLEPEVHVAASAETAVPAHKPADLPKIPKVETVVPPSFNVTGENKKGVVVLVTLPQDEFQKLPQLGFLTKILGAIGLQPADVAYANNVSGKLARFEELTTQIPVNYIISFASRVDTDLPHEKFTLYNPVTVGKVPIVFSQSLAVLDKDQEQKKLLWGALKAVFL